MRDNVHLGARLFSWVPLLDHETRNTATGLLAGYAFFTKNM